MDKFLNKSGMSKSAQPSTVIKQSPADEEMKDESEHAKPKFTPWVEK